MTSLNWERPQGLIIYVVLSFDGATVGINLVTTHREVARTRARELMDSGDLVGVAVQSWQGEQLVGLLDPHTYEAVPA
jgi:hypothetical protein